MAFKKKDLTGVNAALAAANAAASGTTSATSKQYLSGAFTNDYGLKDKNGKVLPDLITGQQYIDAFKDSKNNAPAIEAIKKDLIGAKAITGTVTTAGMSDQAEQLALGNQLKTLYAYTATGQPAAVQKYLSDTKNGVGPSSGQTSTISRQDLNIPNVEASKATINDVFQKYLGRIATEKEIADYTNKYINYAAKNPVSTTTGQYDYGYISNPTSASQRLFRQSQQEQTVSTGLNEADFLKNQVQAGGEYNAFQAAGTAFDLMQRMAQKDIGAL